MLDNLFAAFAAGYFLRSYFHNFQHVRWWSTHQVNVVWDGDPDNPKMHTYIKDAQREALSSLIFTIIFLVLASGVFE